MGSRHVLILSFPAQGHINPTLQFAKSLTNLGIHVTYATTLHARRRMDKSAALPQSLTFAAFSDGHDDGFNHRIHDAKQYMTDIRTTSSKALADIIVAAKEENRPVTCLVYSLFLPWASEVARDFHVPSALLWIQPATVLSVYYYYFHGFGDEIDANSSSDDPSWKIEMPRGIPILSKQDLPSFLLPSTPADLGFALPIFREQIEKLDAAEETPKILVNTFDALEADALASIPNYEMIAIGPLIPPAILNGGDPSDKSFGGDLFPKSDHEYIQWMNTQPESSIVYVSFGSLLRLPRAQLEEIGRGILECGRPFLWVMRRANDEDDDFDFEKLSCLAELEKVGKVVEWCSQLEVLTHPSLGCFVTHCGWNSALESISCGVPMVAFPQWTDQGTNAKLIEDVWGTGVRVGWGGAEVEGRVESCEIRRCIEEVMDGGERSVELRKNARRWKELAKEAVDDAHGSSSRNLKALFQVEDRVIR